MERAEVDLHVVVKRRSRGARHMGLIAGVCVCGEVRRRALVSQTALGKPAADGKCFAASLLAVAMTGN